MDKRTKAASNQFFIDLLINWRGGEHKNKRNDKAIHKENIRIKNCSLYAKLVTLKSKLTPALRLK